MNVPRRLLGLVLVIPMAAACSSSPAADAAPNGADGVAPLMSESTACGSAADTDDINAVSVRSSTGEELSQGIAGAKCIP